MSELLWIFLGFFALTKLVSKFFYFIPTFCLGKRMMFDIYIPSLNIIFEYHGYHHYFNHKMFGNVEYYKWQDGEKRLACNNQGISYVEVP